MILTETTMVTTITFSQSYKELEKSITEGLDFILYHLKEPIWPRNISTKTTEGRQVKVSSKQQAIAWYKAANFLDCRISAYPCDYLGKVSNRHTIDFVMIDLDLSNFKSHNALDRALSKTSRNIKETFGIEFEPSRIWSGNGYHIYIPIESRYVLEERPEFSRFDEPSKKFLRFAEWHLSNGKADSNHFRNVSLGNCLLRIPGSHNSKCVQRNNGIEDCSTKVKIISKWNGKRRAPIYLLIGSFLAYLVDHKFKEMKEAHRHNNYPPNASRNSNNVIPWIEKLLQTPIENYRRRAVWRILAPYLINIRKLSNDEGFSIIKDWLDKCNKLERLNFNIEIKIKEGLKGASKGYYPISLEKLKEENKALYEIITSRNYKQV